MEEVSRGHIILFHEFSTLAEEVEELRKELSALMLKRDELKFVVAKNLEMNYMLQVGGLEYKVYEAQCQMLRCRRKLELIQAQKNRQETIDLSHIEKLLHQEFLDYRVKLEEKMQAMTLAIERSKCECLTLSEAREFKRMYHQIVRRLHPDLNPNLSETRLRLFYQAVNAYEMGDLLTMRLIFEMVSNETIPKQEPSAISALVEEKKRLITLTHQLKEELTQIKTQFPFTVENLLNHKDQLEAYKLELEKVCSQYEEATLSYRTRIKRLMEESHE